MIVNDPKSNNSKFLTSLDLIRSYCLEASEATHPADKQKKDDTHRN